VVIMAAWLPHLRYSHDHGQLPRSTSVNVTFRIWRAMPLWHSGEQRSWSAAALTTAYSCGWGAHSPALAVGGRGL